MNNKRQAYVDGSKHAREDRMDLHGYGWLEQRWARTHNRTCPITGRAVTLDDVEGGKYYLTRINGDSAFGYEVFPTSEHLMDLLVAVIDIITMEPKYLNEAHSLISEAKADTDVFYASLAEKGVKVITDENGLVTEFNNL